ncbi:MAG TPA: S9 family peptidase, partial [Gammaproteobacteria bacterium]|nr:S9 family peptidase [Gammaproteobacteria bacterium]
MDAPRLPAPCGTWPSPLTATVCARAALRLAQPRLTGERVYWIEGRAAEGGRCALVLREADGRLRDAVPAPFSVRSRAQEAGGGAYAVHGDDLWFVNDADQCLWHLRLGAAPRRLTPPDGARYADLQYDARRHALLAVREDLAADAHRPPAALVRIDCADGTVHTLVAGRDFLGAPRLSPDGARLAWLAWDAPLMPWDGTELWLAALDDAGMPHAARRVAGGRDESLCQPEWGPDGALYVMSDRSGWWNLQRVPGDGTDLVPVAPLAADCAFPAWQFGMSSWGFADRRTAVCAAARDGIWSLVAFDLARGTSRTLAVPCNTVEHLHVADGRLVALAGDAATPPGIVLHTFATGHTEVLRSATALELAPDMIATPRAVQFTGAGGDVLHGFYYPPRHARYTVPAEEKPPLILRCHGGPTAA